ncbi:MAG: DEAD/DEAH box helicase [Candidatus Omnitrophica bacterium]|nr:DEAD/DEAH box helicase [Candidatus Omnitrophota bacterium]
MSDETGAEATFEELHLHPDLLKGIHALGFIRPTPIQAKAIPLILSGRDVIGCAQTGTGKTAAFVLPILHKLLLGKSGKHVRALIVAPTRELALQSMEHLKALSRYVHLKGEAIFGGTPMNPQITALERGVDILSATPGRLLDHIYSGRINFVDLEVVVLDEADRMLDMGFLPDIRNILRLLPPKHQNLMFSATMPPEILSLAHEIQHDPVTVQVGRRSAPAVGIRHAVYPVPQGQKTRLLLQLLRGEGLTSVLVFTRSKRSADQLARWLSREGVQVAALHGDRSQADRLLALDRFRYGDVQVLVATDIAARGIDVDEISHVINYDVPRSPDDYVHRIGRTARMDATGDAFTLVDRAEEPVIQEIEKALGRSLPRVTLPGFPYGRHEGPAPHRRPGGHDRRGGHARHGGHPQQGGHRRRDDSRRHDRHGRH